MDLDLPFKIAYAGPDVQGLCKICSLNFLPDELRIAEMVQVSEFFKKLRISLLTSSLPQSQLHDGKDAVWFHSRCFFMAHKVMLTNHIENFENIKYDDQLEIILKIDPNSAEKFKKIAEKRENEASESYKNFGVEYANTNTDTCATCKEPIDRNELRIKKIVFDSDTAAKFGKEILWAHLHCFIFNRDQYDYLWDGKLLTGFNELQPAHQVIVEEALP
jgi:poly [ADP-ribose] polymerase 1